MVAILLLSCAKSNEASIDQEGDSPERATNKVVLSTEINWEALNPARGDKSPKAGTLWGDQKGEVATGFLAKFVDGFSSPPHIHNVTYRAMVIKGLIHNDDPHADTMWMRPGSFWTQPAGEPHITAAKGQENIAYVEIDSGPYLVKPIDEKFDDGEKPINIERDNLVWLDASETKLIRSSRSESGPEIAFLWESKDLKGYLVKLPSEFNGEIVSTGQTFHGILIEGVLTYRLPQTQELKELDPGSYMSSKGSSRHPITSVKGTECIIYIRTDGSLIIK